MNQSREGKTKEELVGGGKVKLKETRKDQMLMLRKGLLEEDYTYKYIDKTDGAN